MLWENTFYEDGQSVADRIALLAEEVAPDRVAALAIEAREQFKLRHVPLWLVRTLAKKGYVGTGRTLARIIQRPDEMGEFLSMYWKDGRQPLSAQVKKGLATAFPKFNAYQLAKYNRPEGVKLRDALFLCHAKPQNAEQAEVWKKLVEGTLESPDTWEVALSAGKDKKETWERLLTGNKLGALALLRNLRNMKNVNVNEKVIFEALLRAKIERILPFRFITAARYAPQWEDKLERLMFKCIEGHDKLPGTTILLVDRSGSMSGLISGKSEISRFDAACALAILLREMCEEVKIFCFNSSVEQIAPRRGFALRDAMGRPFNGTYLGQSVREMKNYPHDRLIVITDEQSHDPVPNPQAKGYMVNVASYQNGVGYGAWTHIDGFSEAIINWIMEYEKL